MYQVLNHFATVFEANHKCSHCYKNTIEPFDLNVSNEAEHLDIRPSNFVEEAIK